MSARSTRFWTALAPVPATVVGLALASSHGVQWTAYAPNLVAILLGAAMTFATRKGDRLERWAPPVAAIGVAATLLGSRVDGVARWIGLGGLQVHASSLLAPWLLLGLSARSATTRRSSLAATVVTQLVHVAQPDAGQATALAAGVLALVVSGQRTSPSERLGAGALGALAAIAWARPDPLAPIDHVERVFFLAFERGGPWVVAVAVAALPLFAVLASGAARSREPLALAALAYFAVSVAVTFVGQFPVPVLGAGFASTLGWYALAAVKVWRRPRTD
jgi:hypothetical protein